MYYDPYAAYYEDYPSTGAWEDYPAADTSAWEEFLSTTAEEDFPSSTAESAEEEEEEEEDGEGEAPFYYNYHSPGECSPWSCRLPHCRCVGTDIPGDLPLADVPQMVLLTFDDAVKAEDFHYFDGLFPADYGAAGKNPNGCRAAATFFVSGSGTDTELLGRLAARGSEVASHSHTHSAPSQWSRADWDWEMQGMRLELARGLGLSLDQIAGTRAPFLQLGGDDQFSVLRDRGFLYDSSMFGDGPGPEADDSAAPLWPFTLEFPPSPSPEVCDQPGCPSGSYPGLWEVPLIGHYTPGGEPCTMTDGCPLGSDASKEDVVAFLRHNFQRHYRRNRAPFMISLHATWFHEVAESYAGLGEFLRQISQDADVWQVTVSQMLDWVRHPLPLSRVGEIPSWQCSG